MSRKIYFAGSIRGGRDDAALYGRIIEKLKTYGTVFTEHVGKKDINVEGKTQTYRIIILHVLILNNINLLFSLTYFYESSQIGSINILKHVLVYSIIYSRTSFICWCTSLNGNIHVSG